VHFATPALLGAPTLARDNFAIAVLQDSPSFSPPLFFLSAITCETPIERETMQEMVFSRAKRFVALHGERGAFRIGNLVRVLWQIQQVLLVREEEEWRTGPVQGLSMMKRCAWA